MVQPRRPLAEPLAWGALVVAVAGTVWSWWAGGIVFALLRSDVDAAWKVEQLQQFFADCGIFAPGVYFLFVTAEVVIAPLPGLMLYAPGGVIFGAFLGGALSLAGNVAGAGIACTLARSLQPLWLERFFARERLAALQTRLERRGGWLIFLLRVNPLTSSDLVSYAAGFTRIAVWRVMLATCFGMAPLCFAQSWLAHNLLTAMPQLLYPLLGACVIYLIIVLAVLRQIVQ